MTFRYVIPLALLAVPAAAEPVEHPSLGPEAPVASRPTAPDAQLALAVEVVASAGEVDPAEVRAAIAAELALRVVEHDALAPALGRLIVTLDQAAMRVVYHPAEGSRIERSLALPPAPADRVQLIAFVAANLVRDQASELLAALVRRPRVASEVAPARVVIEAPRELPPPASPPPSTRLVATIGLVPPLAADRIAGSRVIVGLGVHAFVGVTDASQIASVSGLVDVQRQYATGLQVGGLAATAGRLDHAVQVGGLVALSRGSTRALQVGGLAAIASGDAHGMQVGGLTSVSGGSFEGIQVGGLASLARGHSHGVQIGGVATVARSSRGLQIGGVTSIAERVHGVQIGGVATIGGDVTGVQLGVVNVARRMRGLQLGVVNVTENSDDAFPIGLLNIARDGRVEVDGWIESTRMSAIALRHGPRRVHNLVAVAWSPDHEHVLAGFGLGMHMNLTRSTSPITLDLDAVNWWTDLWHGNLGQLEQLRATIAVPLGTVDLIAGAAANVYISDEMDESASFHPVLARRTTSMGGTEVVAWPSVFAGIRLRAR